MTTVNEVIAQALGIKPAEVKDDLAYQSFPDWDSLGHVNIMSSIETAFELEIAPELVHRLRTVADIKGFVAAGGRLIENDAPSAPDHRVHRGLDGVEFDHSAITRIDGELGELEYRGFSIHDLVERASAEEVMHLLIEGYLPSEHELQVLRAALLTGMTLPDSIVQLIGMLRAAHPLEVLRTAVSALGALSPLHAQGVFDETIDEARARGLMLLGSVPMILATHLALRDGRAIPDPGEGACYAEIVLKALTGESPDEIAVRVFNRALIIHADHSSNASTFTARVATSTEAGMINAITAAIATFTGRRHGGASEGVLDVFDELSQPEEAESYVARKLAAGEPVMGFGHRVYRVVDPRAGHLRECVLELSEARRDDRRLKILDALAAAMAPRARHGVAPNVDLYAGLTYRLLGIPDDVAVAIFVLGRLPGWIAHVLEQRANNVLIRPLLRYKQPESLLTVGKGQQ
ncbi:citrate/2-methylcitrate synthase [Psychromicrobium sp. YIM B11713]|uniref:citrate/2-methylcitrate synthase n=1 Tax=Psychromicrobium sp. YIM B11713 TaxID=3145233 RepID=UPI00374F4F5E